MQPACDMPGIVSGSHVIEVQIDPEGKKFDPLLNEAMVMLESDAKPDTVIEVVQNGYQINDRLLRPARVVVAKAAE